MKNSSNIHIKYFVTFPIQIEMIYNNMFRIQKSQIRLVTLFKFVQPPQHKIKTYLTNYFTTTKMNTILKICSQLVFFSVFHWQATIMGPVSINFWNI